MVLLLGSTRNSGGRPRGEINDDRNTMENITMNINIDPTHIAFRCGTEDPPRSRE